MRDASAMRSDLKLQVSVRKLACVLDPALLLCHAQGPTLALRLTQVMEPWLTRSFWQALDASELLLAAAQLQDEAASAPLSGAALAEWLALREATEPGAWLLRWVGDCVADSRLHDEADMRMLERWEQCAESLSARQEARAAPSPGWCRRFDPARAAIDALAMSATLEGAVVLCEAAPQTRLEPHPVAAARAARLGTRHLEPMPADSLFSAERQLLRQSLAQAGLAGVLEDRLRLAAVHVQAPAETEGADPWQGTRVAWYTV